MRSRSIAVVLVALAATTALAVPQDTKAKRTLLAVIAAPGGSVSITFVQIGAALTQGGNNQASLDLGQLSYLGGCSQPGVTCQRLPNSLQVSTDFGIRVDRKGNPGGKTATVSAFLLAAGTTTVSIDAVQLLAATQVISSAADFGVVVPHALTLGIPTTSPPGALSVNVGVMATTN